MKTFEEFTESTHHDSYVGKTYYLKPKRGMDSKFITTYKGKSVIAQEGDEYKQDNMILYTGSDKPQLFIVESVGRNYRGKTTLNLRAVDERKNPLDDTRIAQPEDLVEV